MIPWHGGLRGCAVDVSRGDGKAREDSLENEVLPRWYVENMLNSTTVALNLANTHRYKPQSCKSPDDSYFPEMTRTAMIWKDLQERATRESELPGYQAENPTWISSGESYGSNSSAHIRTLHSNRHI